jgi:hypothetical protein
MKDFGFYLTLALEMVKLRWSTPSNSAYLTPDRNILSVGSLIKFLKSNLSKIKKEGTDDDYRYSHEILRGLRKRERMGGM